MAWTGASPTVKRLGAVDGRINQQTEVFHQDVINLFKMHQDD